MRHVWCSALGLDADARRNGDLPEDDFLRLVSGHCIHVDRVLAFQRLALRQVKDVVLLQARYQ